MGADFRRRVFITRPSGEVIELNEKDPCQLETTVTLTCDGPRCAPHHGSVTPFTVTWVQEKVGDNPANLPDDFAHGIKVEPNPFENTALWFCGPHCAKDYLTYVYVTPKSPREKAAEQLPTVEHLDAAIGEHEHPEMAVMQ